MLIILCEEMCFVPLRHAFTGFPLHYLPTHLWTISYLLWVFATTIWFYLWGKYVAHRKQSRSWILAFVTGYLRFLWQVVLVTKYTLHTTHLLTSTSNAWRGGCVEVLGTLNCRFSPMITCELMSGFMQLLDLQVGFWELSSVCMDP